jgi:hypothetical protein
MILPDNYSRRRGNRRSGLEGRSLEERTDQGEPSENECNPKYHGPIQLNSNITKFIYIKVLFV